MPCPSSMKTGAQDAGNCLPARSFELAGNEGRSRLGRRAELAIAAKPGLYLLEEARRHIITYLDWVTHDLARGPSPGELRREIEHAAERLLGILLALRDLLDDGDGAM